ncbi:GNAT family N-acetyltransferase [Arthrobacter sp. 1P04PC]|uniref:GNAT family N-acetyltransferase n=1 Tax=unclassified Arthrobacter TaxID=235627 RepID=UPI0039A26A42
MSRSPDAAEPIDVPPIDVVLVDVTEAVLEWLLAVALADADADEVTPPRGGSPGWNADRVRWFLAYHRAAAGLEGPAREKTWAVTAGGTPAGAVRLKAVSAPGTAGGSLVLETGIWLRRSLRGQGIGREALRLVTVQAAATGAAVLTADTATGNAAARSLLAGLGSTLADDDTRVTARIPLP